MRCFPAFALHLSFGSLWEGIDRIEFFLSSLTDRLPMWTIVQTPEPSSRPCEKSQAWKNKFNTLYSILHRIVVFRARYSRCVCWPQILKIRPISKNQDMWAILTNQQAFESNSTRMPNTKMQQRPRVGPVSRSRWACAAICLLSKLHHLKKVTQGYDTNHRVSSAVFETSNICTPRPLRFGTFSS